MGEMELRRDEELLAASGDRPAHFVALYDRTLPGLLGYFARRTLDAPFTTLMPRAPIL